MAGISAAAAGSQHGQAGRCDDREQFHAVDGRSAK